LYKDEKHKIESKKKEVEDKKVILIKLYKISKFTLSTTKLSFINDEVDNLIKFMKFIWFLIQMRLFWLFSHYQSFLSREEQDSEFWKEVVIVFVNNKHNINSYKI